MAESEERIDIDDPYLAIIEREERIAELEAALSDILSCGGSYLDDMAVEKARAALQEKAAPEGDYVATDSEKKT
jgi:hypothetical protein